jgi:hypothetical protein
MGQSEKKTSCQDSRLLAVLARGMRWKRWRARVEVPNDGPRAKLRVNTSFTKISSLRNGFDFHLHLLCIQSFSALRPARRSSPSTKKLHYDTARRLLFPVRRFRRHGSIFTPSLRRSRQIFRLDKRHRGYVRGELLRRVRRGVHRVRR